MQVGDQLVVVSHKPVKMGETIDEDVRFVKLEITKRRARILKTSSTICMTYEAVDDNGNLYTLPPRGNEHLHGIWGREKAVQDEARFWYDVSKFDMVQYNPTLVDVYQMLTYCPDMLLYCNGAARRAVKVGCEDCLDNDADLTRHYSDRLREWKTREEGTLIFN